MWSSWMTSKTEIHLYRSGWWEHAPNKHKRKRQLNQAHGYFRNPSLQVPRMTKQSITEQQNHLHRIDSMNTKEKDPWGPINWGPWPRACGPTSKQRKKHHLSQHAWGMHARSARIKRNSRGRRMNQRRQPTETKPRLPGGVSRPCSTSQHVVKSDPSHGNGRWCRTRLGIFWKL